MQNSALLISFVAIITSLPITRASATGCNYSISTRSGSLTSPSLLPPNSTCEWRITADHDETIIINIYNLKIPKFPNCSLGHLDIKDGYWTNSPSLGKFCGEGQINSIATTGNKMLLTFITKNPNGGDGFVAQYEAICGGEVFVDEETVLQSPNYPGTYPADKKCIWTIVVPEEKKVVLQFDHFDLEHHSQCLYDYVAVTDEDDSSLKKYCGERLPPQIISSSNRLQVKFQSDATIQNGGFVTRISTEYNECTTIDHGCAQECVNTIGSYECSCRLGFQLQANGKDCEAACGGTLTAPNGTITPCLPDLSPPNVTCVWEIVVPPHHHIQLNLEHIDLEICIEERLKMYDQIDGKLMVKDGYCRSDGLTIHSLRNKLKIVFIPKVGHQGNDFIFNYTSSLDKCAVNQANCRHGCLNTVDSTKCICNENYTIEDDGRTCRNGCNYEISSVSGTIYSPGFPGNYPDRSNCKWLFTTTPGHRVRLTFFSFQLEAHKTCDYDRLTLFDGSSPGFRSLGTFCNKTSPNLLTSSSNDLFMVFRSDPSTILMGFEAAYFSVCGGVLQGSIKEKYVYSHAEFGSSDYDNNTDCEWTISNTMRNQQIRITFLNFQLEDSEHCRYDFVEVFDGVNSSTSLGKYCGDSVPSTVVSSNETLVVRFHTDGTTSNRGFSFVYSFIQTSNLLTY